MSYSVHFYSNLTILIFKILFLLFLFLSMLQIEDKLALRTSVLVYSVE